jgi:hypothetical protein
MSYRPEKKTRIEGMLNAKGEVEIQPCFAFILQFNGYTTPASPLHGEAITTIYSNNDSAYYPPLSKYALCRRIHF